MYHGQAYVVFSSTAANECLFVLAVRFCVLVIHVFHFLPVFLPVALTFLVIVLITINHSGRRGENVCSDMFMFPRIAWLMTRPTSLKLRIIPPVACFIQCQRKYMLR